jgi:predicted permease
VTFVQLTRRILIAIVVIVFFPLLMMTVIGLTDASVGNRPGSALALAAVLVVIWMLWFAAVASIARSGERRTRPVGARLRTERKPSAMGKQNADRDPTPGKGRSD